MNFRMMPCDAEKWMERILGDSHLWYITARPSAAWRQTSATLPPGACRERCRYAPRTANVLASALAAPPNFTKL